MAALSMYVGGHVFHEMNQTAMEPAMRNVGTVAVMYMIFAAAFFLANIALMLGIPLLKRNRRLTWSLLLGQCGAGAVVTVVSAGFAALLGYVFHDRLATLMLASAPLLAGIIAVLHVFARQQAAYLAARDEVAQSQRREAQVAEARRLAEARLQTLQAQIEPHFLYNTLANVQHMIAHRPDDAQVMLTGLIRYLRESLPRMRSPSSNLKQEFGLAQAYLDIACIRLGGRLSVQVALPGALEDMSFPPLVVQTLVENALKHGVEPKVGPVTIRLEALDRGAEVCVRVVDSGKGFGAVQGAGVGLTNIRERLAAIYGTSAHLTLAPNEPAGVVAEICIPRKPA
jgi:signal transduction histidine kinase